MNGNPGISREDVVVLIAEGAKGPYPLDPIRLMKGCFLVFEAGAPQWRRLFAFKPYDYGPFDSSVYRARDALLAMGLLAAEHGERYETYALTAAGRRTASDIRNVLGDERTDWILHVGRWVTSKSFAQLLNDIYSAYPRYAERSVMRT